MTGEPHGLTGVADAGAFVARLVRFDRAAVVRLRSVPGGHRPTTELWGRLPWNVLVTRRVAGAGPGDATVAGRDLLGALSGGDATLPARRDEAWRWPLPPARSTALETVSGAELSRLAAAAAGALREAATVGVGGQPVGERVVRDALLDHVALTVIPPGGEPVSVPQRLVQAIVRMGFAGTDPEPSSAEVRVAGRWIALSGLYGVVWLPSATTLTVVPPAHPPNG